MMRRAAPFAVGLFALALMPLVPGAARAQTTPEGAQALEKQVHDWIISTLGPNVKIAQRPIQVTANGDHYDIAVPFGDGPDAPRWTATAQERSGGRYAIDDVHIPSPAEFHVKLPDALAQSAPPGASQDITYKINIGSQTAQLLIDPTFATTTTSTSAMKDVTVSSTGGMAPQTSHIDSGTSSVIIQPATAGRIDVALEANLDGYTINTSVPNGGDFKLGFGKTHMAANATSISRQHAVELLQAAIQLGKAMSPSQGTAGTTAAPPPTPEAMAAILQELADLASGASIDETLQDLTLDIGGLSGSLHAMQIGFGAKGVNGLLQARLDLGAEGLTLPDLGLGPIAALIPTRVALRPTVSGVPSDALMALVKASGDGNDPTPADIMALFARGPIVAGLESMSLAVGGAEFNGLGTVNIASPQDISGTGQITATHLDALQQQIAADPTFAQAGPAIIFLKGIGRTVGEQMVWDITYRGGRLLVNNQDLSAMTGQAPPPPAPPAPPVTRPAPPAPPAPGQPQLRRRQ